MRGSPVRLAFIHKFVIFYNNETFRGYPYSALLTVALLLSLSIKQLNLKNSWPIDLFFLALNLLPLGRKNLPLLVVLHFLHAATMGVGYA